jgi:hypothetical protein
MTDSSWLIKIEVDTQEEAEYILEHLQTDGPIIDSEIEELEC